jgi:hypothetical protein
MGIKVVLVWSEERCCVTMFTHILLFSNLFNSLRLQPDLLPPRIAEFGFAPH